MGEAYRLENSPQESIDPENWVEKYGDALYGYALLRVRDREVAEELVQETYAAALSAQDRFQGRASEKTWLTSILKNKVYDHFRKMGKDRVINVGGIYGKDSPEDSIYYAAKGDFAPHSAQLDPHNSLEKREFWETLSRCLSELPPRLAQVFILRELEGIEGGKICEKMDISSNNLWVMLYRARRRLRSKLRDDWLDDTPGEASCGAVA